MYTYTWVDRPVTPQLAHLGVYNITVVELDGTQGEPVRVLSRVDDVAREALQVGLEVGGRVRAARRRRVGAADLPPGGR